MNKESLHFIYFPYLIHEIRDAAIYNFPQMTKTDFSQTAFVSQFDESLAKYYYIDGKRGEAKKIILDRNLVE